ncbi:MAG: SagB/ThcOx family dehydrogenase [Desulfovibrio sp.]|jgi:hypothetical protein|nr:SagB/ThcOx family dehydrogenase [Desulfovibrio sp.]
MRIGNMFAVCFFGVFFMLPLCSNALAASAEERLTLAAPDKNGGKPLMQALALRATNRAISQQMPSDQDLGNLFWAAWGVNRTDGRRTVPTARNSQAVALYAVMSNGVWRYEGENHELIKVLDEDVRAKFGGAPLTLLFAAEEGPYAGMHVGSMYQNVGLYCASAGLSNVVKANGVSVLHARLPLPPNYSILIVQSLGVPK